MAKSKGNKSNLDSYNNVMKYHSHIKDGNVEKAELLHNQLVKQGVRVRHMTNDVPVKYSASGKQGRKGRQYSGSDVDDEINDRDYRRMNRYGPLDSDGD